MPPKSRPPSAKGGAVPLASGVYHAAFDRTPDALFLLDPEARVVEHNEAAQRLPLVAQPAGGEPFVPLWPRPARPAIARFVEQLVEERDAPLLEVALPGPAGELFFELCGCALDRDAGAEPGAPRRHPGLPPLRIVLVRDVTERVRLADRALHSERLASVGRLAATLAHEIRNTLAGVDGALQVFETADDLLPVRREIVVEMRDRIGRTREVVDDLLAYARPPRLSKLASLVDDVLQAMRDSVSGHPEVDDVAVVTTNGVPAGAMVEIDAFQVRLVARNLILNGAQAMGGRGEVRVAAELQGGDVLFRFEDDGPGVPDDLRERIFEPFFTTRPSGTGLGLSIAAKIVEAHGGRLLLDHAAGRGSCFLVALPLFAPPSDDDAAG